jgi:hypothetical protein
MPDKLLYLLKSRKFWATVVAIVILALGPRAGIDQAQLTEAVLAIVAYIIGTTLEDGLRGSLSRQAVRREPYNAE